MKLYILEFFKFDYECSYTHILGVYDNLDDAREFIYSKGYKYCEKIFDDDLEQYEKEDRTITIIERDLNKDYSISSLEG